MILNLSNSNSYSVVKCFYTDIDERTESTDDDNGTGFRFSRLKSQLFETIGTSTVRLPITRLVIEIVNRVRRTNPKTAWKPFVQSCTNANTCTRCRRSKKKKKKKYRVQNERRARVGSGRKKKTGSDVSAGPRNAFHRAGSQVGPSARLPSSSARANRSVFGPVRESVLTGFSRYSSKPAIVAGDALARAMTLGRRARSRLI
jgi:hypothetical protein